MSDPPAMVFLGYGKYVRADRIYALEPIADDERGDGRRTRVWVEGIAEPLIASRTERTILSRDEQRHHAGCKRRPDGVGRSSRFWTDARHWRATPWWPQAS